MENLTLSTDGPNANDGAPGENDAISADVEVLEGGEGNDVIMPPTGTGGGTAAPHCDDAFAGATALEVCGRGGDDTFPLPVGLNVAGGEGRDTVDFTGYVGIVIIREKESVTCGSTLPVSARVREDVEVIVGSDFGNDLVGGDGPNELVGGDINDCLDGGLGPDELIGGDGEDTASYGSHDVGVSASLDGIQNDGIAGEDFIHDDVEILEGGSGPDHLTGSDLADLILGGEGDDVIEGGGRGDALRGGDDDDEIHGGDGQDELFGGSSDDTLFGDGDRDTLLGGSENDSLHGGDGHDLLDGGIGADVIVGDGGDRDKVTYEDRTARVEVTLRSGANDGEAGEHDNVNDTVEWVLGGSGNDEFVSPSRGIQAGLGGGVTFYGNGGNDTLKGGNGADFLFGGLGNDTLLGGDGPDRLHGDENRDKLEGEGGPDDVDGGPNDDFYLRGNGGADEIFADDGNGEDVNCGSSGGDVAHVDGFDDVSNNCENVL